VLHKFYSEKAAMVAMVISGLTTVMVNVDAALPQMLLLIHMFLHLITYTMPM